MKILVQGESRETTTTTVGEFLKELDLLPSQVAVEHNGVVLFRHELAKTPLKEGDRLEIVKVVAGG